MFGCIRTHTRPVVRGARSLSLLRPTRSEKRQRTSLWIKSTPEEIQNSLLYQDPSKPEAAPKDFIQSLIYSIQHKKGQRLLTSEEQDRNIRLNKANKILPEALAQSVANSMLKMDYTSVLNVPDTSQVYWSLAMLHTYPISVRLMQCSAGKFKLQTIKKKLCELILEDFLARLKCNRLRMSDRRKFMRFHLNQGSAMMLSLQEGLLARDEKVLANAIWLLVLQLNCPLHEALLVTDWVMETLVKLESYSEEEFVELCLTDGFEFPLLGEHVAQQPAPETLHNYMDAQRNVELGLTIDGMEVLEDGTICRAEEYHYHNGPLDPHP